VIRLVCTPKSIPSLAGTPRPCEKNDSFLLYLNSKAVAIGSDFASMAQLGETVPKDRPEAELTIRVADRLCATRQSAVNGDARCCAFDRAAWTRREVSCSTPVGGAPA
jgi:hypothetical protein